MTAYYNEIDPFAAQWLRELIKKGHIAPGIVDERSIEDVRPDELNGFTQCHFFAGIGVWSYALRQAGWPDDRPVWTGSCPCQPFSSAGKGGGFADERHLWPSFHWLIDQCRPECVLGEQVAGKDGLTWLDLVCNDLEKSGYACGASVTAACGFGAPHQRKRLYWVGNSEGRRQRIPKQCNGDGNQGEARTAGEPGIMADTCGTTDQQHPRGISAPKGQDDRWGRDGHWSGSPTGSMADTNGRECDGQPDGKGGHCDREARGRDQSDGKLAAGGKFCGMANASSNGRHNGRGIDGRCAESDKSRAASQRGTAWCEAQGGGDARGLANSQLLRCNEGESGNGGEQESKGGQSGLVHDRCSISSGLANSHGNSRREGVRAFSPEQQQRDGSDCEPCGLADTGIQGSQRGLRGRTSPQGETQPGHAGCSSAIGRPGPTNGHWRDADWLYCRDGKWRPVEPSTFPLAHGAASRVGRLRGYGNGLVAQQAQAFIEAFIESSVN